MSTLLRINFCSLIFWSHSLYDPDPLNAWTKVAQVRHSFRHPYFIHRQERYDSVHLILRETTGYIFTLESRSGDLEPITIQILMQSNFISLQYHKFQIYFSLCELVWAFMSSSGLCSLHYQNCKTNIIGLKNGNFTRARTFSPWMNLLNHLYTIA